MIPAIGIKSLTDWLCLDESLVIELPDRCVECESKLWNHGSYERWVSSSGQRFKISVPRVICSQCRRSHAGLYTFLVPHKLYSVESYNAVMELHLSGSSYREAAWTEEVMSASTAFRAITEASEAAPEVAQVLQAHCVEMEIVVTEPSFNARAKRVLRLAAGLLRDISAEVSCGLFLWWRRVSKPSRRVSLVFRLSAPQSLQHGLF